VEVLQYEVPGWGVGELWHDGDRVVNHELPQTHGSSSVAPGHVEDGLVQRVREYFAGAADGFEDVELDLDWTTPFQRAVAEALRAVPYGEIVTYGELAALAGHPNAQRAAGTFCAGNRFPIFVPCHRVVAADGLGSYGSLGLEYKRRLLALEGCVPL
jgi:methylated-DNA-[protein]-cysteine S-methyltransferase